MIFLLSFFSGNVVVVVVVVDVVLLMVVKVGASFSMALSEFLSLAGVTLVCTLFSDESKALFMPPLVRDESKPLLNPSMISQIDLWAVAREGEMTSRQTRERRGRMAVVDVVVEVLIHINYNLFLPDIWDMSGMLGR